MLTTQVLFARHADERNATYQHTLLAGRAYVSNVKALLLRLSLARHQFQVTEPKRPAQDSRTAKPGRHGSDMYSWSGAGSSMVEPLGSLDDTAEEEG